MVDIQPVTRTISGKGVIKIPDEFQEARQILLYVDLLRLPSSEYANFQWNPPKRFYAHVTFCKDEYVLYEYDVNFRKQVFEVYNSQPAQNLMATICALDNVLDSFVSFALSLGFFYTKNNSIEDFPFNTFLPNTIRFQCYTDCALRLVLSAEELRKCDPGDGEPVPPPPPPPPPDEPPLPPGTPLSVSPPYEGENDDGDTVPAPIDEPDEPPLFPACSAVVVLTSTDEGNPGNPVFIQRSNVMFFPVENLRVGASLSNPGEIAWLIDSGVEGSIDCPLRTIQLSVASNPDATGEILSITLT